MLRHPHAEWILKRLVDAGPTPMVTHPERNTLLQTRTEDLARWVDNGWWPQLTAGSITGAFGRRAQHFSDVLMKRGLRSFAGERLDVSVAPLEPLRRWFGLQA